MTVSFDSRGRVHGPNGGPDHCHGSVSSSWDARRRRGTSSGRLTEGGEEACVVETDR